MRTIKLSLAVAVVAAGLAACGGDDAPRAQATPHPPLDGLYGAQLNAATLRELKPPVLLSGGWWTLTVDVGARRITLSQPEAAEHIELRVTAVGAGHIELAPDPACEQRGRGRTQPARLTWSRTSDHLRLRAVDVPCLTDEVLLTRTAWLAAGT